MHTLPSNFPTLCSCWQKLFLESESWGRVRKPPPLPEFGAGQLFVRAAAPRLRPLQLLLASIRFNCCSPFASASSCCFRARLRHPLQLLLPVCLRLQLLLPDCVRFSCCSQSLPLRLLLPDCDCFMINCCSSIALDGFQPMPCPGPMFSNILRGVRGSVNKLKYEGRASL